MKYYAERNGLLEENCDISFEDLKEYFNKIYNFFDNKEYFEVAIKGVWKSKSKYSDELYQVVPPLLSPDPTVFFINNLQSQEIYPIYTYYQNYTEEQLFTVLEILYDKISLYDYSKSILETKPMKEEFAMQINNILKLYDVGYFLEPTSGTVTKGANEAVKHMLSEDYSEILPTNVMTKMRSAIKMYYRFDSSMEYKKQAIVTLATILENQRDELKDILNKNFETNKNDHDKLIFNIVNEYEVRHDKPIEKTNYNHEIWYDWMMQYYTSVIIAYYRLILLKK
ncbi:hypothetical protein [Clostridium estertheticum]|uniref:hypothetical protein n=1 Tax=Clostridium estertheticum TaxID=238834 RepID=UPI001C0D310D|nr:hypothetical protein [Clostridium estertheticum]MBU3187916.1 hypothetical protein [Clostridium estertheticum]